MMSRRTGAGVCMASVLVLGWSTVPIIADAAGGGFELGELASWSIVVAEDAIESERFAAEEFRDLFKMASGETIAIVSSTASAGHGGAIFIGPGKELAESGLACDPDTYSGEQLRIVAGERMLAIFGGRPRGTLYGVYTFVEDYLGVRFLTAAHTHVPLLPKRKVIGPLDRTYEPVFAVRWNDIAENKLSPLFSARIRCNGYQPQTNPHPSRPGTMPQKFGGVTDWVLVNHSFFKQIPSSVYGKDHPEYFALHNGERLWEVENDAVHNQPCLTNPDVLDIVTAAVLEQIEQEPDRSNFRTAQNDNDKYCQCQTCAAVDEQEGSHAGSLLTFVNAVADRVAQKHPGVQIGTLAYHYSRRPPKHVRPRANVQIQLAPIRASILQPLNDITVPMNKEFVEDFDGWAGMTDNIYMWLYNTNFSNYLLPMPNLRTNGPTLRYLADAGVKGVMYEDAHDPFSGFADIRNYQTSRLLWDPYADDQALVDEFLRLHYGSSAGPIRRYIERLHDCVVERAIQRRCFGSAIDYGMDDEVNAFGVEMFRQALAEAETPDIRRRVEKASIAVYAAAVDKYYVSLRGGKEVSMHHLSNIGPLVHRYIELLEQFDVPYVAPLTPTRRIKEMFDKAYENLAAP